MVEILEYVLAFAFSSIFAGASIAVFNVYYAHSNAIETGEAFASLMDLTTEAKVDGSSTAALSFPQSTISCSSGNLILSSSGHTESASIGLPCDFIIQVPAGVHNVTLSVIKAELVIQVG